MTTLYQYQDYDIMLNKINTVLKQQEYLMSHDNDKLILVRNIFKNYNEDMHIICKRLYECDCDKDINVIKDIGNALNDIGGLHAMQLVYYTLTNFSPIADCLNKIRQGVNDQEEIKKLKSISSKRYLLEHRWDGIGEWRY